MWFRGLECWLLRRRVAGKGFVASTAWPGAPCGAPGLLCLHVSVADWRQAPALGDIGSRTSWARSDGLDSRLRGNENHGCKPVTFVIPAQAGIQYLGAPVRVCSSPATAPLLRSRGPRRGTLAWWHWRKRFLAAIGMTTYSCPGPRPGRLPPSSHLRRGQGPRRGIPRAPTFGCRGRRCAVGWRSAADPGSGAPRPRNSTCWCSSGRILRHLGIE